MREKLQIKESIYRKLFFTVVVNDRQTTRMVQVTCNEILYCTLYESPLSLSQNILLELARSTNFIKRNAN